MNREVGCRDRAGDEVRKNTVWGNRGYGQQGGCLEMNSFMKARGG